MAASLTFALEGEANRVAILEYMKGREVTNRDIQAGLTMSKSKVENYLRSLQNTGHIVKCKDRLPNNEFKYKRTNKLFYTMAMKDKQLDGLYDDVEEQEEEDEVVTPINSCARIVRLLKNPLPPAPSSRKSSLYNGIQSGMGLFDMESGL
jgi:predicted transcriptional regulator